MIFRAVFWIGLVSLLTPHEPDLGLGRPGAGTGLSLPVSVLSASGLSRMVQSCGGACAGGPTQVGAMVAQAAAQPLAFSLPGGATLADGLAKVRAEIEQDRQARDRQSRAGI